MFINAIIHMAAVMAGLAVFGCIFLFITAVIGLATARKQALDTKTVGMLIVFAILSLAVGGASGLALSWIN